MVKYITCKRLNVPVVSFNQAIVTPKFFELAKELGYYYRVTGGNDLTHEIDCTEADFKTLLEMSQESNDQIAS